MLFASLKTPPSLAALSPSACAPVPAASFPPLLPSRGRFRLSAAASEGATVSQEDAAFEEARLAQFAADWKAVRADKDQGKILTLPVLRSNTGGIILKYNSMQGFMPNPLLSLAHWCKDPKRPIQDVTKDLVGSFVSVKVAATTKKTPNTRIPNYPSLPSQLLCQVHNITMHVGVLGSSSGSGVGVSGLKH
ncbi:uncharacterized protein LOC119332748 isoform X1 [Triticum dicoccoides]|uniref:uncharacterized protein LOC119332748 isoform X1 n=1 Tax=Triticum dicoccoides TaxID=85692 RepID=UPI001890CC43|nr:uncharacterized protein LOC119332748 isoform X1 [Triticum dicoccoides]